MGKRSDQLRRRPSLRFIVALSLLADVIGIAVILSLRHRGLLPVHPNGLSDVSVCAVLTILFGILPTGEWLERRFRGSSAVVADRGDGAAPSDPSAPASRRSL